MSCAPAWIALVAEALVDAGAHHGLDREQAGRLVADTVAGTGELLAERGRRARGVAAAGHLARWPDRARHRRSRGGRVRAAFDAAVDVVVNPLTALPLAISRVDIADYVETLMYVYLVLIFIRIIAELVPLDPVPPVLSAFLTFVNDVTNPYLNLFRRFIPMARARPRRARPQPDRRRPSCS